MYRTNILLIFLISSIVINLYLIFRNCEIEEYKKFIVNKLIRQASRWSVASKQDKSSMIAVLHANYGVGYLWSMKDILSDNEIEKYGNIDLNKFENEILEIQDKSTKYMAKLCPSYAPEPSYLSKLGGEGV